MIQAQCVLVDDDGQTIVVALKMDSEVQLIISRPVSKVDITLSWNEVGVLKDLLVLADNNAHVADM
jgi:hypothetical protein